MRKEGLNACAERHGLLKRAAGAHVVLHAVETTALPGKSEEQKPFYPPESHRSSVLLRN